MNLYILFFNRYLFSRRSGSVVRTMARLCWVATLIGVFALIVVLGIMSGFNRSIRQKLLSAESHLRVIVNDDDAMLPVAETLHSLDIKSTQFIQQDIVVKTGEGQFAGAQIYGVEKGEIKNYLTRVWHVKNKDQDLPDYMQDMSNLDVGEVILGTDLARDLNVYDGDEIVLLSPDSLLLPAGEAPRFEKVKVRSTLATDIPEIDNQFILFSTATTAYRFLSKNVMTKGYEIRLEDVDGAEALKEKLQDHLRGQPVLVETWADRNQALFYALRLEKTAMSTLLGLSVLITSFSLVTVLIMLISQKRREVGVLMSLGLSQGQTTRLFLFLGLVLSSFGLFIGMILGVIASRLIEKYPINILPDIYYDSYIPSETKPQVVFWVFVGCVVMALLSAIVPVRLYLHKNPAQNLRPVLNE